MKNREYKTILKHQLFEYDEQIAEIPFQIFFEFH